MTSANKMEKFKVIKKALKTPVSIVDHFSQRKDACTLKREQGAN